MKMQQLIFIVVLFFGTFLVACNRLENVEPETVNNQEQFRAGGRAEADPTPLNLATYPWERYVVVNHGNPYNPIGILHNVILEYTAERMPQEHIYDDKTFDSHLMQNVLNFGNDNFNFLEEIENLPDYHQTPDITTNGIVTIRHLIETCNNAQPYLNPLTIIDRMPNSPEYPTNLHHDSRKFFWKMNWLVESNPIAQMNSARLETLQNQIIEWENEIINSYYQGYMKEQDFVLLMKMGAVARYSSAYWTFEYIFKQEAELASLEPIGSVLEQALEDGEETRVKNPVKGVLNPISYTKPSFWLTKYKFKSREYWLPVKYLTEEEKKGIYPNVYLENGIFASESKARTEDSEAAPDVRVVVTSDGSVLVSTVASGASRAEML